MQVEKEQPLVVYGHPTCPMVPPVRGMLNTTGVPHQYINIHADAEGAAHVRYINNGNESVPTLVFPDGSTLTEPSAQILRHKLKDMGYHVPMTAMVWGYLWLWMPILLFLVLMFIGIVT